MIRFTYEDYDEAEQRMVRREVDPGGALYRRLVLCAESVPANVTQFFVDNTQTLYRLEREDAP